MKNLTLVIHASAQEALADRLRACEHVRGFTFTHVEGHSDSSENDPLLSARDRVVGYVPRVRTDLLLEDADVATVLAALLADGSFKGQGVYWVSPVERLGRL